jgi:hypothetical protein
MNFPPTISLTGVVISVVNDLFTNQIKNVTWEHRLTEYMKVMNPSWTSQSTPHTSHPTPHTSHLTPHTSHLTPHTSHLTPHTSHPIFRQNVCQKACSSKLKLPCTHHCHLCPPILNLSPSVLEFFQHLNNVLPSCFSQSPRFNLREASLIDEMEVLSKLPRLVFPPLLKVYIIYSFCNYFFFNTIALASSHRFFALQLSAN